MCRADRLLGLVRLTTQDGIRGTRIAFLREVSNPAETREVLVEMMQQACQGKPACLRGGSYPKRALWVENELSLGTTQSGSSFVTALILVLTG
jgi:hypothetical protein